MKIGFTVEDKTEQKIIERHRIQDSSFLRISVFIENYTPLLLEITSHRNKATESAGNNTD